MSLLTVICNYVCSQNCENQPLSLSWFFDCPSIHVENSALSRRIFKIFDMQVFFWKYAEKVKFH